MNTSLIISYLERKKNKATYNYLLVGGDGLQGLLDDPAAVHLQSQGQHVATDPGGQGQLLVRAPKLPGVKEDIHCYATPT